MRVQQILKSKPDGSVTTVLPDTSIADVVALLTDRRIGAVIVSHDGHAPDGILSERDIVRGLAASGTGCLSQKAAQLMTADPVSCRLQDESDDVFRKMTEGRFRHLPVVENGVMVGLISIGDVVKSRLSELSMEKTALEGMIMGY